MASLALCIFFMCLGAISLTLFLLEKTRKYSVKAVMLKSVTSLLFIAVCACGLFHSGHHILGLLVMLGLLVGLLGDIWLDFKYVYKEHDLAFTYAGFTMFGIGHILYISGMFFEFYKGQNILYIILPLAVGIVMGVATVLLEKPMQLKYGRFKWIAFAYGIVLFSMSMSALSLAILYRFENVTLNMMFAGGVLFAISDLILSGTYFGEGKERPVDIIANSVVYYAAQFVIAFAIFFL